MTYGGEPSLFETSFGDVEPGRYELQVVAADAAAVNFGMATRALVVRPRSAKE